MTPPPRSTTSRLLPVLVEGYLLESSLGRVTRGFATLQVGIVLAKARMTKPELSKAIEALRSDSCILVGEYDSEAIDVSVTAIGLFRHGGGA